MQLYYTYIYYTMQRVKRWTKNLGSENLFEKRRIEILIPRRESTFYRRGYVFFPPPSSELIGRLSDWTKRFEALFKCRRCVTAVLLKVPRTASLKGHHGDIKGT